MIPVICSGLARLITVSNVEDFRLDGSPVLYAMITVL